MLFVAIPVSGQTPSSETGGVVSEMSKRFILMANYAIVVLVVTGIGLTAFNEQYAGIRLFENRWNLALILKHLFVLGIVVVHFFRGLVLTPRIVRAGFSTVKASLQKLSMNLVKAN